MFYLALTLFFIVLFDGIIVSVFGTSSLFEPMLTMMGLIVLANYFDTKKLMIFTTFFAILFSMMFTTTWVISAINIICVIYICHQIAKIWSTNLIMVGIEVIIGICILMISTYFATILAGVVNITFFTFFISYLLPTILVNLILLPIVYVAIRITASNILEEDIAKKYK